MKCVLFFISMPYFSWAWFIIYISSWHWRIIKRWWPLQNSNHTLPKQHFNLFTIWCVFLILVIGAHYQLIQNTSVSRSQILSWIFYPLSPNLLSFLLNFCWMHSGIPFQGLTSGSCLDGNVCISFVLSPCRGWNVVPCLPHRNISALIFIWFTRPTQRA